MDGPFRIDSHLPVGVSFPLPIDQVVMHAAPFPGSGVIPVKHQGSVAGCSVAVQEKQVSTGHVVEFGVCDPCLQTPDHGFDDIQFKG